MKVYIATSLSNADEAKALSEALAAEGIETTYTWWTHGAVWAAKPGQGDSLEHAQWRCADAAIAERNGVKDADLVIVILTDAPSVQCSYCFDEAVGWSNQYPAQCLEHLSGDMGPYHYFARGANAQRGTHTELGMAIVLDKQVYIYAPSAARFETDATCAFYFAPTVGRRSVLSDNRVSQMVGEIVGYRNAYTWKPDLTDPIMPDEIHAEVTGRNNNPASVSGYGHDTVPSYYTNNPDGKETIDRMFEEADRVCANFGTKPGYPIGEPLRLTSNLQQALRAALCAAMALKYEDRAGRKGDPEGDKREAAFYRAFQARWEQNNPDLDPRKKRKE